MEQFKLENNKITLTSKPSPLFARGLILFFAIISILLPVGGMIGSMANGNRFHIGFLITTGIFGLIGFYLLRVFLWNSYGKETIVFSKNQVTYEADYKWFKDGKKTQNFESLEFSIKPIGYQEDNIGTLVIESNEDCIESVVKMPNKELDSLILELKQVLNNEL